jgi:hypothetical protein
VYAEAQAFAAREPRARARADRRFEARLCGISQPYLADQAAPQRTLCARLAQHSAELFVFMTHPEVPANNNAAERSLRHLVTAAR